MRALTSEPSAADSRRPVPGRLVSINISAGGVPKRSVREARVTASGIEGDRQRFWYHGGRDRAVVLFAIEAIAALQLEGHPIDVGTTGENFTISGLDWNRVTPGAEVQIGDVRVAVTKFAAPCETITPSFVDGDIARIAQKRHPGWSRVCARVLVEGIARIGDAVNLFPRGGSLSEPTRVN